MRRFTAPISGRKVRFALVGCGRIAKNHFSAIAQHRDRCALVGVSDIDPRALSEAAGNTGAVPYLSLADMLANCDDDAFILCTPSGLHSEQAVQIARAGRHVITEMPMATRWEDGKRMVTACDVAGGRDKIQR